jgi:ssDNA-binding Zn-finger/Zn-ribbon topoisomerase 1
MQELGDELTNADCENIARQMGKNGFAMLYRCNACNKEYLAWGAYGQPAMNVDEVVYAPSAVKKAKITKIECAQCHHNARIRFPGQNGDIVINAKLVVEWSDEDDISEGDRFDDIKDRLNLDEATGECPHCEDEASVTIHFDDGTKTDSVTLALQKIGR